MSDRRDTVVLGLELRLGEGLLAGRLVREGEADRAFTGWLEFISVIERLQHRPPTNAPIASTTRKDVFQ